MSIDMQMLILTHLRAALERRDWKAVSRAYVLLGGVGAGEPGKGAGGPETSLGVVVEPPGWTRLENVR